MGLIRIGSGLIRGLTQQSRKCIYNCRHMFSIEIVPEAIDELQQVPIFHRRTVEETIEKRLRHEPEKVSKNCKLLEPLVASFEYDPPLWELRVGEWRIFYDVQKEDKRVVVRAVRKKPSEKQTQGIL